jgi:hypothetical protein
MSFDPTSIEADLRRVRPAGLDASLLERLDACASSTWTELAPAEIAFEQRLLAITPAKLPPALMASLESSFNGLSFPKDVTIVPFPQRETAAPHHHRGWWGAAAAVALTGAVTALLIPANHSPNKLARTSPQSQIASPAPARSGFVPAGFNRGLSEASDEGVVWQSNNQPHRVLKVVYKERVTYKDADGRTHQVERPRVEYILVPAKID